MIFRMLALAAPLTMIAACTNSVDVTPTVPASVLSTASTWTVYQGGASSAPAAGYGPEAVASGTFLPFRPGSTAITYDAAVVPPGATAEVAVSTARATTTVRLSATGLIPRRAYGAHLHTQPCTGLPAEAGPHYQHQKDPAAAASPPSVDPAYANPANEVWLDFTADTTGAVAVTSKVAWTFPNGEHARSLIVHAQQTKTAPGVAGTAGPRVACLTLPAR
jgi:Cu-Zn family superoxide dismutase